MRERVRERFLGAPRTARTSSVLAAVAFLFILAAPPLLAQTPNPNPPTSPVKLIFIHHSTGEGWLADGHGGLGIALKNNKYFVSDTNYGWGPSAIGDLTDIGHWYRWFLGPQRTTFLNALYAESAKHSSYTRLGTNPGGLNKIVMFKSCFPNSAINGHPGDAPLAKGKPNPIYGQSCGGWQYTVANVKGIYRDLLDYFATRKDTLFILIVTPPLTQASTTAAQAANARGVADWLMSAWLAAYPHQNVRAFDYYHVLTSNGGSRDVNDADKSSGNHHRFWSGQVQHTKTVANNYSAYGADDYDSHPTAAGQKKATAEFAPLLNIWYNFWKTLPSSSLTVTAPAAGAVWTKGSTKTIAWTKSGKQSATVKIQLYRGTTKVLDISAGTPNDGSFPWSIPASLAAGTNYKIRITTADGYVSDDSALFKIG